MGGSYVESVLKFIRNCPTIFRHGRTILMIQFKEREC